MHGVADVIPIFALSHVLLPGAPLPLHVFEERYRRLLADVTSGPDKGAFGVVALTRGAEVNTAATARAASGPPGIAEVGTLAEILEVEPRGDGTSDVLTIGSRRFRIRSLVSGLAYLRADVEWLEESDGDLRPAQVAVTQRLYRDFGELLAALTDREPQEPLPRDANLMSYHVAGHVPLDPRDRQLLLAEPTAASRLHRTIPLLRREIRLLQSTRSIAIAPSVLQLIAQAN